MPTRGGHPALELRDRAGSNQRPRVRDAGARASDVLSGLRCRDRLRRPGHDDLAEQLLGLDLQQWAVRLHRQDEGSAIARAERAHSPVADRFCTLSSSCSCSVRTITWTALRGCHSLVAEILEPQSPLRKRRPGSGGEPGRRRSGRGRRSGSPSITGRSCPASRSPTMPDAARSRSLRRRCTSSASRRRAYPHDPGVRERDGHHGGRR